MNKIYRSVWSALTGTWVAAQENAVGRGKKKSKAGVLAVLATPAVCAGGFMLPTAAWADFCSGNGGSVYNYASNGAVANCAGWVGNTVGGDAVGSAAFNGMGAGNTQIVASSTQKKLFLSPGAASGTAYYATLSNGTTGVLLSGLNAGLSASDAVNVSQLTPLVTALGGGASFDSSTGAVTGPTYTLTNANAITGQSATMTQDTVGDAFDEVDSALGKLDTSVNTMQGQITALQGQTADAVMYDSSAHSSVTFGGIGATTPVALHNVAAGALSAVSTDAVNGSQLYATNQQVAQNTSDIADLQTNVSNLGGQMADAVSYDSSAHDSVTLGGAGATTPVALHNVAAGTADTDAVNVGQMNDAIAAVSQEAASAANPFIAANGDRATEGAVASGTHATAVGPNAVASGNQATALGANASASGANSVALGAGSVADRDNTVSVGSAGSERQITNVAAGTAGTDAVNVDQLNAVTAQSQGYVDSRIAGVQKQVSDVQKEAFGAAAAAMAVAGLPQPTQPGKTMVAAGASRIGGQTGAALGVSYVTENNKWVGKLAASSSSQGNTGVTVGAGYQW